MTDPYQVIERREEHDFIIRDMRDGCVYGEPHASKVAAFNAALRLKHKEQDDFLTTVQAAQALGVTVRRVQALINGTPSSVARLPAQKIGRDWMIRRADLAIVSDRPCRRPRKDER